MTVRQHGARPGWGRRVAGATLAAAAVVVAWSGPCERRRRARCRTASSPMRQAARGQALYVKQCASCHGDDLKGAQAPPLVGDAFSGNWRTQPLSALASKIRNTMPADARAPDAPQTADRGRRTC